MEIFKLLFLTPLIIAVSVVLYNFTMWAIQMHDRINIGDIVQITKIARWDDYHAHFEILKNKKMMVNMIDNGYYDYRKGYFSCYLIDNDGKHWVFTNVKLKKHKIF